MNKLRCRTVYALLVLGLGAPPVAHSGDWPAWRYDAQRSAASPQGLPAELQLHWERRLPQLRPAWPDQPKMQFDAAYEPIIAGQRLFIGSSHDNCVTAYDTRTGEEIWTRFTDGPVRFAPTAWQDKLYVASDDGYFYCLRVDDGTVVWRFRGGPSDRKVLGNERLISAWPARGAPVIAEGRVYFAAGIWPFEGVFLHALDAQSGNVIWTNDGDGSIYITQPHNADSFAGVAPQGPLVAVGDRLLIPGGRSVPACYDRTTGRMIHYLLAQNAKRGGGSTVASSDRVFFNGGQAFDLETGVHLDELGEHVAFDEDLLYSGDRGKIQAWNLKQSEIKREKTIDRKGQKVTVARWSIDEIGEAGVPRVTALIKAGSRLYTGSEGRLLAFELPLPEDDAEPIWEVEIEGTPLSLAAADDRLFAATREGGLYCFGPAKDAPKSPIRHKVAPQPIAADPDWSRKAEAILRATATRDGYCIVWGIGSGGLIQELTRRSDLRIVAVEPDANVANEFRARLRVAGIGGDRISVLVADPLKTNLPPYLASLSVAETLPAGKERVAVIAQIFAGLRPYGGVACLPIAASEFDSLQSELKPYDLANAEWKTAGEFACLTRAGALPGSADWTHEHADAANTRVSKDSLVKAPLGLLWFGGPTNDAILPRHGHGPQPQVLDGRLYIEGVDLLRAMDIYTGRVLWEAAMPGVGELYDNTAHQPGANASGTNFISTREGIYIAYRNACRRLDPATGEQLSEFQLPPAPGSDEPPLWGYINVFEDYLIGGADPLYHDGLKQSRGDNDNYSSSNRLIVLDRRSGKVLWTATARSGFRHNAICLGGGRLYCIDRVSGPHLSRLKRRGEEPQHKPRLVVFDLASGKELWSTEEDVFGTWLSFSAERDVLVEAGRVASDTLSDEPKGMRAYNASAGNVLWENKSYSGPAMLHHDTILMAGKACDLLTGKPRMREHPLSGELVEWTWSRNYGCNTPAASEHLLTFRSGAAGYFDFCNDGGTGNFGGFRSSCTNNLIVAGGLLNAPDYTRTCVCSYQNQTSLALAPMPGVEMWTSFGSQTPKEPVRRVGINLAAPGDRKADDGTLWLEYPSVGGSSPEVQIKTAPEEPEWFRRHSSQIDGEGLTWVAASGAKGLTSMKIELAPADKQIRRYTVRLHFTEPDSCQPGERVFQVKLQGHTKIDSLDVRAEAGGQNRSLVKEIPGVEAGRNLTIELIPHPASKERAAVLCGVEVEAEGW